MSVREAAVALGMSERAIRNRIERGDMQATRIGARVFVIPRSEVERWQQLGRKRPGPKPRTPAEERRQDEAEHDEALDEARRRIRGEAPEEQA